MGKKGHKQLTEEERLQREFQGLRAQLDAERSKSARLEKERGGQEDKCRAGFGKLAAPWEGDPCCVYPSSLRATNQGELYADGRLILADLWAKRDPVPLRQTQKSEGL